MLIDQTSIIHCYEKIQKKAINGCVTVFIFVAFDADSLCSLKILTGLLKSDNIAYKVLPVTGFSQLEASIDECQTSESIQSMIFINCGGVLDLTQKWFVTEKTKIKAYIFDNHRPIHHHNIADKNNIVIIDDGTQNQQNCPEREDEILQMTAQHEEDEDISDNDNEDQDYSEEDDDDLQEYEDEDEGFDENGENKLKNKLDKKRKDLAYEDEEEEEFGKKDRREKNRRKRRSDKKLKEKKMEKKLKIEQHKQKMENYYEGFYYGKATSMLMYKICQQANKENNNYLWYTILGATDLLIHGKITQQQYDQMYEELVIEVEKVNIQKQEFSQDLNESIANEQRQKNIGFIEASNEYRFICLRNWNLYESIYYSNYFATKLEIWNENGDQKITRLIALLGIPLEEAKQQYKFMKAQFKEKLKDNIHSVATKYKLYNVLFNSFVRQIDEKTQVSSTDMVYCLTAILECPKQILQNIFEDPLKVGQSIQTDKTSDNSEEGSKNYNEKDIFDRIKNFWWAYETISSKEAVLILKGIDIAIQFQKAMVNEAKFVIDRDLITQCSDFRFLKLNNDTYSQNQYFQHPYSLQKLALFLMGIFKEKQKSNQPIKPIVLSIKNSITQTQTIIGVVGNHYSASTKNDFAFKFQSAAKALNLQYKQDDFETSIIEIKDQDFDVFLDEITLAK
ncbi:CDC45-like protein (macronuclear) [Tetrahymena thermophila SB210]|uniref:CDC45-like protein n=1 Tax=Tetrahymena thermophila (strain SB210) TaxID=312017 RepID=I7MG88_TETTS|nr:CDC45-like protein [Tetrahymena thermophila SB210]EAR84925.3 CDC45-like protein [Tetrahymena thermophila SB210]|eukprot:XP_001032588.3 CDC45-like protein [Tetrahymena thermophila SB210]